MKKDIHDNMSYAGAEGLTGKRNGFKKYFILSFCTMMLALCLNACGGGSSGGSSGGTEESSKWDAMTWDQGTWG